jgi:hypothetical protein
MLIAVNDPTGSLKQLGLERIAYRTDQLSKEDSYVKRAMLE